MTARWIGMAALAALATGTGTLAEARAAVEEQAPAATAPAGEIERLTREIEGLRAQLARLEAGEATAQQVKELERKLDALAREIERMRVPQDAAPASDGSWGLGPAASKVYARKHGVSLGGYGEMLFEAPSSEREDGSSSGRKNQVDYLRAVLYTGYKFSPTLLFNSELEVEHSSTGTGGEISLEFAYLDWLHRPELNLRAGLLLVPMGFLNELHEPTTFLSSRRPRTELAILPATWREMGLGAFGERGKWSWRVYLVNGLDASGFSAGGLRDGRQKGSRAVAESFALTGRLDFQPTLATQVGAALWIGNSGQGLEGLAVRTTIFDLHGEWKWRGLQARALYARASVRQAAALNQALGLEGKDAVGSRLAGGYLELGYDVLSRRARGDQSLVLFGRFERLDTQAKVPAGTSASPASDQRVITLGAAWKPHPQVVVKADYEDVHDEAERGVNQFNLSLGYIF